jgi:plastocyanin
MLTLIAKQTIIRFHDADFCKIAKRGLQRAFRKILSNPFNAYDFAFYVAKNLSFTLVLSAMVLAAILSVSIVPSIFASSNSGPGGGDDDDDERRDSQITAPQNTSVVTAITIPQDAESHSAANPYAPNPATVSSGSTVTWHNADDEDTHTATADDGSFSTGIINPGASGQAVINAQPGSTVTYHCDIHPEMRGVLHVNGSAGGNNPASNAVTAAPLEPAGQNDTSLEISDRPLAVGHYITASENSVNNTLQISVVGNTTITLPNSTETITTNDTGNVTITFTESGAGILEAQLLLTTADGLENATVTATEFFSSENAPGRGIASFSTDSTGRLAPLDGVIAATLDEDQPDGSARVSFFEWRVDQPGNQTAPPANNDTPDSPPPVTAPSPNGGGAVAASITPGSSGKTQNAFAPNPIQAKVGDTVTWTNNDSTVHTVTSGSSGQPDNKFDSSPNLTPLVAPGQTFEHTFDQAGEYPYFCALHPNMVGTVSIS